MKLSIVPYTIAVIGIAAMAFAKPAFVKDFDTTYGIKKTSALGQAKCGACHTGMTKKLNSYGIDLQKAVKASGGTALNAAVMKKVDGIDSDKDGAKNVDELKAGTLPGDAKSK